MIFQAAVPIHNLPLQLVLLSNGGVAFVKVAHFNTIYSDFGAENKIPATISDECITIGNEDECVTYNYNTTYLLRECEILKNWLIQECLEAPWM